MTIFFHHSKEIWEIIGNKVYISNKVTQIKPKIKNNDKQRQNAKCT